MWGKIVQILRYVKPADTASATDDPRSAFPSKFADCTLVEMSEADSIEAVEDNLKQTVGFIAMKDTLRKDADKVLSYLRGSCGQSVHICTGDSMGPALEV